MANLNSTGCLDRQFSSNSRQLEGNMRVFSVHTWDIKNKDVIGNFETYTTVLLRSERMTILKNYVDLRILVFFSIVILELML